MVVVCFVGVEYGVQLECNGKWVEFVGLWWGCCNMFGGMGRL